MPPTDADVLEAYQRLLAQGGELQPNSGPCFACGLANAFGLRLRFVQVAPNRVVAYTKMPRRFQGYPGIVHGGVLASILDEAVTRAGMGTNPATARFTYTARLTLRYRQPVPVESLLRVEGWVLKDRGRSLVAAAALYRGEETRPLVEAEALLVAVSEAERGRWDPEALGWKVYPLTSDTLLPYPQPCEDAR